MKQKILFALGCAMVAGFAQAAQVEGNNVAVVIDKAPVVSETGWQFLCVPVRGFDITGQGKASLTLNELIPPTTEGLAAGSQVQIKGNKAEEGYLDNGTYTISGGAWTPADSASKLIAPGAIVWLQVPAQQANNAFASLFGVSATPTATTSAPAIRFMGEQHTVKGTIVPDDTEAGKMVAYGNATSKPLDLFEISTPQTGDQLLRIKEGSSAYAQYLFIGGVWEYYKSYQNGNNIGTEVVTFAEAGKDSSNAERTIAPGEAFYYFRAN